MANIDFILKRAFLGDSYTVGKLSVLGVYLCDTLEDRVRDYNRDGDLDDVGETKIYGQTAIPFGRYKITMIDSPKFGRRVPLLHGVKHFDAIEIHAGNTPEDTHGCILPGENKERGKVLFSRYWENVISTKIDKFINDGHDVFIKII